jgi:hypothetical protein
MDGSTKVEQTRAAAAVVGIPRRSLRNIALLAICQALTQSSNTLMFASSALAVLTIVPGDMKMWANLPVTMQHLGVMLSVFPASLLMMRHGRRFGFRMDARRHGRRLVRCSQARHRQLPGDVPRRAMLGFAIANMQPTASPLSSWRPGRSCPGDLLCHGGRRDGGIVGPSLALDARSMDAGLPGGFVAAVCIHVLVFFVLTLIEFPVVKPEDRAGPQRPLPSSPSPPTWWRRRRDDRLA